MPRMASNTNARVALQHNLGLKGAVVCTIYAIPEDLRKVNNQAKRKESGVNGFPEEGSKPRANPIFKTADNNNKAQL